MEWDNAKYSDWESSVGLNVYNLNSSECAAGYEGVTNKELSTIHITDLDDPIFVDFNNNGKKRNFIMSVFFDYVQIPFKITQEGGYDKNYTFELEDSKEIKLPLYLPSELAAKGTHKLLISISIGYDIHGKDLESQSDWYGINLMYDFTYDEGLQLSGPTEGIPESHYEEPPYTVAATFPFHLNEDFDYSIIETEIMPNVRKEIEVKKSEKFPLVYNASTLGSTAVEVLMLATINFKQAEVDGEGYKLFQIPNGSTGVGTIELTAPDEPGYYEVIALLVYNPFLRRNLTDDFNIDTNVRFTLHVVD